MMLLLLTDRATLLILLCTLLLVFGVILGTYGKYDNSMPSLEWRSPLAQPEARTLDI